MDAPKNTINVLAGDLLEGFEESVGCYNSLSGYGDCDFNLKQSKEFGSNTIIDSDFVSTLELGFEYNPLSKSRYYPLYSQKRGEISQINTNLFIEEKDEMRKLDEIILQAYFYAMRNFAQTIPTNELEGQKQKALTEAAPFKEAYEARKKADRHAEMNVEERMAISKYGLLFPRSLDDMKSVYDYAQNKINEIKEILNTKTWQDYRRVYNSRTRTYSYLTEEEAKARMEKDFQNLRHIIAINEYSIKPYENELLISELDATEEKFEARRLLYLASFAHFNDIYNKALERKKEIKNSREKREKDMLKTLDNYYFNEAYKDDEEFLKEADMVYPSKVYDTSYASFARDRWKAETKAAFYLQVRDAIARLNERARKIAIQSGSVFKTPEAVEMAYERFPNYDSEIEKALGVKKKEYKAKVIQKIKDLIYGMSDSEIIKYRTDIIPTLTVDYSKCPECLSTDTESISKDVSSFKTKLELDRISEANHQRMLKEMREKNAKIFNDPLAYIDEVAITPDDYIYQSRPYLQHLYSAQIRAAEDAGKYSYARALRANLKNNGEYNFMVSKEPHVYIYEAQEKRFEQARDRIRVATEEHLKYLQNLSDLSIKEARIKADEMLAIALKELEVATQAREAKIAARQKAADEGRFDWTLDQIGIPSSAADDTMGFDVGDFLKKTFNTVKEMSTGAFEAAKSTMSSLVTGAYDASRAALNVVKDLGANTVSLSQSGIKGIKSTTKSKVVEDTKDNFSKAAKIAEDTGTKIETISDENAAKINAVSKETTAKYTEPLPKPIKRFTRGGVGMVTETVTATPKATYQLNVGIPYEATKKTLQAGSLAEVVDIGKTTVKTSIGTAMAPAAPIMTRVLPGGGAQAQEEQTPQTDAELEAAAREAELAEEEARLAAEEAQRFLREQELSEVERAEADLALAAALKELEEAQKASAIARQRLAQSKGITTQEKLPTYAHPLLAWELKAKEKRLAAKKAKEAKGSSIKETNNEVQS